MRDYPGSTPYSPEELAALASPDVSIQATALRAHAEELAAFMEYFIKENSIPKLEVLNGQRTGGLALLTWSMSNILAFAVLANAVSFPQEIRELLGLYLRTVVLFGEWLCASKNTAIIVYKLCNCQQIRLIQLWDNLRQTVCITHYEI
jgi:hypothetical protein